MQTMIWFFERAGEYVRCETRQTEDGVYELAITEPDGSERVERFDSSSQLARRQVELKEGLDAKGWTGPHGREM